MKRRSIHLITILAVITLSGIVVWQVFWFRKAFDVREKEFDQRVFVALQEVGEQILTLNNQQLPSSGLVSQLSSNYFVVSVNGEIDTKILESLLKASLQSHGLLMDFEYGVYDCNHQKLVYGNYVSFNSSEKDHPVKELPQWKNDLYYFSVNFPDKSNQLIGSMGIWLFSSAVLLIVVIFFVLALIIIIRQRQLSMVQKDFVNNMTHEFKTPVSTILVTSRLLEKPEVQSNSGLVAQYTSLIQTEALRLKSQVERVLQVAVWDEKHLKYKTEEFDVNDCLNQAIQSCTQLLNEKHGKIICDFRATQSTIHADRLHFTNAIYNLLDNAIKYNLHEPEIHIRTSNENGFCLISVSDNGIGIDKKNLSKIFGRFFRVSTGDVHDVKGFGLGLYYVKKVLREMGGSINATSEQGKGSTFTIKFPLAHG